MAEEMPAEAKETLEKITKVTKKGFSLQDRLGGRGLRRGSIKLFLDEATGAELGWSRDVFDLLGNKESLDREGVLGEIEDAKEELAGEIVEDVKDENAAKVTGKQRVEFDQKPLKKRITELEKKRDALIAEIDKTSIVVQVRAIPPKIQRDARRKAKVTLKITGKDIPEELTVDFNASQSAHLMALMIQRIIDTETGEINDGATYQDAIDLMDELPPGQFSRLDNLIGQIQFTDSISESIEVQEDFL